MWKTKQKYDFKKSRYIFNNNGHKLNEQQL